MRRLLRPSTPLRDWRWRVNERIHRRPNQGPDVGETDRQGLHGHRAIPVAPRFDESIPVPSTFRPARGVSNPVLTRKDVTDYGRVHFVADPFLFITSDGLWYLFFEVFNKDRSPTAVIGHATSPDGGRTWTYDGVVLSDSLHLAFPYVFRWENTYYMLPEKWDRNRPAPVDLYATDSLPEGWSRVATLVSPDHRLHDCVLFRWDGRWWLLGGDGNRLYAYHNDELESETWQPHERNPVVTDRPSAARPGGRPIVTTESIRVFLQDCLDKYGHRVRGYEITDLTPSSYADRERPTSPDLTPASGSIGWNTGRMHHVDPWYVGDRWYCAVDGNVGLGERLLGADHWAIGIYDGS